MTAAEIRAQVYAALAANRAAYGFGNVDPLLMLAQAGLESGHFTSNLARNQRNVFGMRQPQQRETLSIGAGPSGFATYATYSDGAIDYLMRQQYFNVDGSGSAARYIESTLASNYAPGATNYADVWAGVYSNYLEAEDEAGDGIYTGDPWQGGTGSDSGAGASSGSSMQSALPIVLLFLLLK